MLWLARRTQTRAVCAVLVVLMLVVAVVIGRDGRFAVTEEPARQRSVPEFGELDEAEVIEARADREWAHLTYPNGYLPSDWQTKAQQHIERFVPEGQLVEASADPRGNTQAVEGNVAEPAGKLPPTLTAWTKVGPAPIDDLASGSEFAFQYGLSTGRVNAVAVDPNNQSIAYAGAVAGGLWKTTDCCTKDTRWTPLWEDKNFVTQSVSAIEFDPTNSQIVYVGTGDFDARDQFGVGIMKTTDGGATWTLLGGGPNGIFTPYNTQAHGPAALNPAPTQNIGSIEVDPHNPNTVVVGTQWGFFISRDAGATFAQVDVADPLYTQRVSSIVLDATNNPSTLYVALGYPYRTSRFPGVDGRLNGIYKATLAAQGNPSFSLVSTGPAWPANMGNCVEPNPVTDPRTCPIGRIRLGQSSQNPQRMYAQVSYYDVSKPGALGTWLTNDGGATWLKLPGSTDPNYTRNCSTTKTNETQDWYDLFLGVDPTDDKILYIGRTSLYKAKVKDDYSGFASITDIGSVYGTSCPGYGTIHPDQHGVAMRTDGTFLIGNDGGVYLGAKDAAPGAFTVLNNDFNITQFYAGQLGANFGTSGAPADPGVQYAFGGAQDNGNESWTSRNSDLTWQGRGNGGDGFFVAFDPIAGSITSGNWYTEYVGGTLQCSKTGAQGPFTISAASGCKPNYAAPPAERPGFVTPFTLDQVHCTTTNCFNMILGTSEVWATGNGGQTTADWVNISPDLTRGNVITDTAGNTLLDVRFAYNEPKTAIVSSDDGIVQWSNNIFVGATCTQGLANSAPFACTPNPAATWVNLSQGNKVLPNRAILGVGANAGNHQVVYAAVGGFNAGTPATPGHVFEAACTAECTKPSSWTWTDKTGNLPDVPAASVLSNPLNPKQVFVGTHFGFYYTDDITVASPVWFRFQEGLPNTVIQYLTVDRGNTTLGAFTFGRGLYTLKLPAPSESLPGDPIPTPEGPTAVIPTATATATLAPDVPTATAEPTDPSNPPLPQTPSAGPSQTATGTAAAPTETATGTAPSPTTTTGAPSSLRIYLPFVQR